LGRTGGRTAQKHIFGQMTFKTTSEVKVIKIKN